MEVIPFDNICKESELLSIVAFNLKGVKWYLERKKSKFLFANCLNKPTKRKYYCATIIIEPFINVAGINTLKIIWDNVVLTTVTLAIS